MDRLAGWLARWLAGWLAGWRVDGREMTPAMPAGRQAGGSAKHSGICFQPLTRLAAASASASALLHY